MDVYTRGRCYPGLTEGEIESMSGGVFGHSFLALNLVSDSPHRLQWDPIFCQECRWRAPMFVARSGENGSVLVLTDYNYRCCPACWSIIKKQLWDYLEGEVTENPANRIWSFLVEPATRSKRHMDYFQVLLQTGWPLELYQPLLPMPYTHRSRRRGWSS